MRRVYVASSRRAGHRHGLAVSMLRAVGLDVYDWRTQDAATTTLADKLKADASALDVADLLVLVLPAGASSHAEFGWAAGQNKPAAIWCDEESFELLHGLADFRSSDLRSVVEWACTATPAARPARPVLFVGEDNPYGADPYYALYDEPEGASGHRLRTILGLSRNTYLGPDVRRANLCEGGFSAPAARLRASEILVAAREEYRAVVMLGAKVGRAFGLGLAPLEHRELGGVVFVSLPHPSGRNRVWNDPRTRARARALIRSAGLPTGEADS